MIDQIKTLATPIFLPSQYAFRTDAYLGFSSVLNLEESPPLLCVQNGDDWNRRQATDAELSTILAGLQANPPHPQEITAAEALARFTPAEQNAAFAASPQLAYRLFTAAEPFAWQVFADSVGQLVAAGVPINSSRILGPQ